MRRGDWNGLFHAWRIGTPKNDLAGGKLKTIDVIQEYILCLHFMFLHITSSGIQVMWVRLYRKGTTVEGGTILQLKTCSNILRDVHKKRECYWKFCPSDAVWLHHHSFSRIFWWQIQNILMLSNVDSLTKEAKKKVQFKSINKIFRERIY